MADFSSLLQEQKQKQDKEQVAISEAAQTFALQIQKENKLGQDFIKREGISNAAVSVVQNFQQDLDLIADADFTGFKDIVEKYRAVLGELEDSRRFDNKEKGYIKDVIAPVLAEVYPLANVFAKVRFGLRDFVKQFKPIKLAARTLGGIPILGTAIQKKIERQEAGEQELRRAERKRGQDIAREERRSIQDQVEGVAPETPSGALEEFAEETRTPSPIISAEPDFRPVSDFAMKRASGEEEREELQAKKDDQFEEQKGLLEMIAESTYESNENLKRLVKEEEGILDDVGDLAPAAIGGTLGAGGTLATGALAKKFLGKGGPKPSGGAPVKKTSALSKAGKFLKGGARVAGKLFLPVTAAIGLFDAFKGASQADEILGKDKEDLTIRDKASAGVGGLLEGLSFGLIKKDKVAKFLAGKQDENIVSDVMPTSNDAKEALEPNKPMKDVVNIDSKRTNVRTTLETDSIANSLEKLFKDMPQGGNTVIAPNNTLNTATSTNVLPDLSNKNLDTTANSLKNVY